MNRETPKGRKSTAKKPPKDQRTPNQTRPHDDAQQLWRVISHTPFMLTRCNRNLRYVFVSPAYAALLGR
jgi:hypothetical protein